MSIDRLMVKRMWYCCCRCLVASRIQLIVTPWSTERQASLSTPTPGVCSNLCPSNQWCHPTITSSVIPFSSCLQSFPHQDLFQWVKSHQVAKGLELQSPHQSFQWIFRTGLGLTGLISLQSKGLSRVFFNTTVQKYQLFGTQLLSQSNFTSIHDYWKNHSLD